MRTGATIARHALAGCQSAAAVPRWGPAEVNAARPTSSTVAPASPTMRIGRASGSTAASPRISTSVASAASARERRASLTPRAGWSRRAVSVPRRQAPRSSSRRATREWERPPSASQANHATNTSATVATSHARRTHCGPDTQPSRTVQAAMPRTRAAEPTPSASHPARARSRSGRERRCRALLVASPLIRRTPRHTRRG
jgi:hypothetical protein